MAHGLAYIHLIQHYGEICSDYERGRIGTAIHLFLLKGGVISSSTVIKFFTLEGRMDVNRFLGLCSLFLTVIAILMCLEFYQESPAHLIRRGKVERALQTLMHLRKESSETPEISEQFNKLKESVAEEKLSNTTIFCRENLNALIVVLLLRLAFVLTFNYAMKYIHFDITKSSMIWSVYKFILTLVHTFTVFFVLFTIDKGKRLHFMISATGSSIILIVLGCLRTTPLSDSGLIIFIIFIAFELFSAIGIGQTSHIYSTEAFASQRKSGSIAFTCCIEHFLQILIVLFTSLETHSSVFDVTLLLTSGITLAIVTIYLYFRLPETKNLSINEARKKFL